MQPRKATTTTKAKKFARFHNLTTFALKGCVVVALCLMLMLALGSVAQSQAGKGLRRSNACSTEDARSFTDDKAQALLKKIGQQQKAVEEKLSKRTLLQAYKNILRETFAYDTVARGLVGPYWRKMSASQQEKYTTLITSILESTISNTIYKLPVVSYDLSQVSRLGKDFAVSMAVSLEKESEALSLVWRVRCFASGDGSTSMGVVDVIFRSVSVIAGKRRQMTDTISKQGVGAFLQLLALERDRLKAQER